MTDRDFAFGIDACRVTDPLAERDDDFRKAAERVLRKNADLYRRLA
jgi:hypothetical protein